MFAVTTVDEVVDAFHAFERAEEDARRLFEAYRELLRSCIDEERAEGARGNQKVISHLLGRNRETLRQDAMTDEERQAFRESEAERQRLLRQAAKRAPAKRAVKRTRKET